MLIYAGTFNSVHPCCVRASLPRHCPYVGVREQHRRLISLSHFSVDPAGWARVFWWAQQEAPFPSAPSHRPCLEALMLIPSSSLIVFTRVCVNYQYNEPFILQLQQELKSNIETVILPAKCCLNNSTLPLQGSITAGYESALPAFFAIGSEKEELLGICRLLHRWRFRCSISFNHIKNSMQYLCINISQLSLRETFEFCGLRSSF